MLIIYTLQLVSKCSNSNAINWQSQCLSTSDRHQANRTAITYVSIYIMIDPAQLSISYNFTGEVIKQQS